MNGWALLILGIALAVWLARHSFVTAMRSYGVDLEDLKVMLGHELIATTSDTYSHPNMDELAQRVLGLVGDRA